MLNILGSKIGCGTSIWMFMVIVIRVRFSKKAKAAISGKLSIQALKLFMDGASIYELATQFQMSTTKSRSMISPKNSLSLASKR